jgi:hypothetical protein
VINWRNATKRNPLKCFLISAIISLFTVFVLAIGRREEERSKPKSFGIRSVRGGGD